MPSVPSWRPRCCSHQARAPAPVTTAASPQDLETLLWPVPSQSTALPRPCRTTAVPHLLARTRAPTGLAHFPSVPGSSGRSLVSSVGFSLKLISGVILGTGARGDLDVRRPWIPRTKAGPHSTCLFLFRCLFPSWAARTWPGRELALGLGCAGPRAMSPTWPSPSPPALTYQMTGEAEGGPVL